MKKLVIKYFFPAIMLISTLYSQQLSVKDETVNPSNDAIGLNTHIGISIIKNQKNINQTELKNIFLNYQLSIAQSKRIKEESPFNIVSSSFRSNIRFGGFWDKYAIINFTPQMYIKPFDFLSVYAQHNISCFIPMNGIKEHFKPMAIQSAAVMAAEASLKFLFPKDGMVKSIIGFAVKNLIIFYMMKSTMNNAPVENQMLEYENYYYSLSIRF